ncbi:MAG: heme-binding protein [Opitutae bacterium]|nr:heme-binding protein [Opitutae bacterium]
MIFLAGAETSAAEGIFDVDDLQRIFTQAADRATEIVPDAVIAVVDRDGRTLLVRRASGSNTVTAGERAIAVAKAGTAVFLSSNQQAFTPRTAGFIIQQNFPPGVFNRPPGPLVGVGFSNLAFSDVNYFREANGSRIAGTRLYGSPGGVPLFKDGVLVAGIGVTGDRSETEDSTITGADLDEAVALAGQIGYAPRAEIFGHNVFIDGISVPYVLTDAQAAARPSGRPFDRTGVTAPAPVAWPTALLGGVVGQVRAPITGDPLPGLIDGQPRLTEAEVRQILANAAARTLVTRAGIRLPAGQVTQVFITVVNNPAQAGVAPAVLGTFRTPDATVFSWDVSAQKARTAVFFSNRTRAFSSRSVGFLAQSMFPPGISGQPPGPFNGLQETFSIPLLSGTAGANPNLPNGITIFPGGFPLYRNGALIGAIGVSGDGIDQDDLVAASGTAGFQPDPAIRADNFLFRGARLPYAKFPRDAELRPNAPPATSIPLGFEGLDSAVAPSELNSLGASGPNASPADPASASQLFLPFPVGLALDGAANLYIADASAHTISRLSPAAQLTVFAGTAGQSGPADGSGSAARFNQLGGVSAAAGGTLSVADSGNATLRRITGGGVVTTLAGSVTARGNTDGAGSAATFSLPVGVAQDAAGTLFVADALNNTIRRISPAGVVSTLAGSPGNAGDADGLGSAARFNHPTGIAVDSAGNVFVADSINNLLRKISPAGAVSTLAGLSGVSGSADGAGAAALFNNPGGLAVDSAGHLFVADTGNSTVRRVTPAGVVTTFAGLPQIAGLKNGPGGDAWFNHPRALAFAANGDLYVADTGNGAIRLITPAGNVSTLTQAVPAAAASVPATPTPAPAAPASTGGSAGGGGAPSHWFAPALAVLWLLRRCTRREATCV